MFTHNNKKVATAIKLIRATLLILSWILVFCEVNLMVYYYSVLSNIQSWEVSQSRSRRFEDIFKLLESELESKV